MLYSVLVFNHESPCFPMREIGVYKKKTKAMVVGCKIIHALVKDYNEDLYVFMETKDLKIHNMFRSGVHIYNGNVPWSVFVVGAKTEPDVIGPLTGKNIDKEGTFDFNLVGHDNDMDN